MDHSQHTHHGHGVSTGSTHEGHDHHGHGVSTGSTHEGHERHEGHDHSAHDPAQFRRRFWVSLALTIPTLVFSTGLQEILGLSGPRFAYSEYIPAVFGTILFFYGGLVFLKGAWSELRAAKPGMMTLISLAIVVAFGYSIAVTFGFAGMDFWWELATLITIMLLGHWIEMSAVMGAQNALGELAKLIPDEAELVHGTHLMPTPVSSLAVGDRVLVRPGASIPVDGVVVDGESEVDEALLTGESADVVKAKGDTVVAGSINRSGSLTIEVTRTGSDTALAGVMKLVAEAQASKSAVQVLADRAAAWLFYVAVGAALITLVVWWLITPDDPAFIVERVVTVLVIACPHALGLAIPLVAQISTSLAARNGILVRSRAALEEARRARVVLFDKTGTLTEGRQGVTGITVAKGSTVDDVLALAAAVEAKSEHPIAHAIVAEAKHRGLKVARSSKFTALAGLGAEATVADRRVMVASQRHVTARGLTAPSDLVHAAGAARADGAGYVFVVVDEKVVGLVTLADVVRAESAEAVRRLHKAGMRVAMLTGDSHAVAENVAAELGIDEVFAEVLPGQKAQVVADLQEDETHVIVVGDGVNDAPALAKADVGIAIGAGTDVAIESAGIVLASSDPRAVLDTIKLSRATYRKMQQNLFWATGYNLVGIPLAAGVLFGAGVLLSPALGAIFMSVSTIVVALNAQLLRRLRLRSS
jgi:Cu2+-exporting ATPase